jgi:hypothetical protein
MTVGSTHAKSPAVGWDISASARADAGEKIARAQIIVNGSTRYDRTFDPPIATWQESLTQQGLYPGDNTVQVIATNDKAENTESDDSWS